MQRDTPDGSQTSAGSQWQGLARRWEGLVCEAANHRGFSGCVQPPPFRPRWVWELPWMEWNWSLHPGGVRAGGSALRSLETIEEMRQWTLEMVLGIDVHPSQRSSGRCHYLLTQEHIYSAWRGERAAKATSGPPSVPKKPAHPGHVAEHSTGASDVQQDHHYQIVWGQAETCGT